MSSTEDPSSSSDPTPGEAASSDSQSDAQSSPASDGSSGDAGSGQQTGYQQQPMPPGQAPYPGMVPAPVGNCQNCGYSVVPGAVVCTNCQAPVAMVPVPYAPKKEKLVAGLLAIFLGGLGIHKFYLGYNTAGGIMLGLTISGACLSIILIGLLWAWIPGVIALIEGIIYLTKSDYDFEMTYVVNKKEWF